MSFKLQVVTVLIFFTVSASTKSFAQFNTYTRTDGVKITWSPDRVNIGRIVYSDVLGNLEINGHLNNSLFRMHSQQTNYIRLIESENSFKGGYIAYANNGTYSGRLILGVNSGNSNDLNSDVFSICIKRPDGFVGIKQLSPAATLDVNFNQVNNTTAIFRGTERNTNFITGVDEHVFLRGGKLNSNIFLNDDGGSVAIGTNQIETGYMLTIDGKAVLEEIKVQSVNDGADFVFEEDYDLPTLQSIEKYIKENKHLPDIPSAKEMQENGVMLGEMNILLLQKIEELTLHMIEQEKQAKAQQVRIEMMEKELNTIKSNQSSKQE